MHQDVEKAHQVEKLLYSDNCESNLHCFSTSKVVGFFPIDYRIVYISWLITFERIKPEWWDWAHSKDLFKSFPDVTKFFLIHEKSTELWSIKDDNVTIMMNCWLILPSFVKNFQTIKARNVIKASGARIRGSWARIGVPGAKIGSSRVKIGALGPRLGALWLRLRPLGSRLGL